MAMGTGCNSNKEEQTKPIPSGTSGALSSARPSPTTDNSADLPNQARTHLAGRLGVSANEVEILRTARINWPDSCLGLPSPGQTCAQVVTAGYHISLRHAGRWYGYPADMAAMLKPEEYLTAAAVPPVLKLSLLNLAERLHTTSIEVALLEEVEWPDSCLGYPQSGEVCAQVRTLGYRVVFADTRTEPPTEYEYHADLQGKFRVAP
jgi:hypothetical protein